MDTIVYNQPDFFTDALPDPVEMLYKTEFNQAWGKMTRTDLGNHANDAEGGSGMRPIDSAHRRAAAKVEKHYAKTRNGNWIKKLEREIVWL